MSLDSVADSLLDHFESPTFFDEARWPAQSTRIGPNAILQTRQALDELVGYTKRAEIYDRAGLGWLSDRPISALVYSCAINAQNAAVADCLSAKTAELVMQRAGELTAAYIIENRIPKAAKRLLKMMPRAIGIRLLLAAIEKNAWTFAGSSKVTATGNTISIYNNPICLGRLGYRGCVWHQAVFNRLFQTLVSPELNVTELACAGKGHDACVFEVY